jgi:hypothetical protein
MASTESSKEENMPIGDYVKEAENYRGGRSPMQYGGCIDATALSRRVVARNRRNPHRSSTFRAPNDGIRFAIRGQDQEMSDCFSSGDSIGELHGPAFPAPGEAGCSDFF